MRGEFFTVDTEPYGCLFYKVVRDFYRGTQHFLLAILANNRLDSYLQVSIFMMLLPFLKSGDQRSFGLKNLPVLNPLGVRDSIFSFFSREGWIFELL